MMTENELNAIRERLENATNMPANGVKLPDDDWQALVNHAPEDIAALLAEVERLRGQIDAVREHHVPVEVNYYAATVTECCSCPGTWPCPTISALDGEVSE